ncbi:MAG: MFS transporter [Deltaproteobacteria bacterium]|nr:MFS transporter [Deltaproteobacteria bacterium]MBW2308264.1 MFS transporter [Deltaproteobacteria bacterium]
MRKDQVVQGMNLSSIAAAHGFSDGFHYVLIPVLPMIMKELGLSILQTGMIISAQGLAVFIMLMPASILSDYLGKRKAILAVGLILASMCFFGVGSVGNNYHLILALSFLAGVGNSTFHPTATALVSEGFRNRPGFFMGIFSLGGNIGSATMPAIIGTLALSLGWRSGLHIVVLPVIVLAILVYLYFPETRAARQTARDTFSGIWDKVCRNLPVVTLISIYALRGVGYRGVITFFPLLIASTMGADSRIAGFLMSVYFILGAVCKPILGSLYDRFGVRLLLAMLFFVGAGVSIALAGVTSLPVMIILMALLGMVSFISPILMTAATSLVDRSVRTSTVGMIYTAHELQFLSPMIGGWIAQQFSLPACFMFFAVVLVLGGGVSLLLQEKRIPRLQEI